MANALLSPLARQNAFYLGQSAPGAKLYTYAAGGVTTPQPTYSNAALTVENTNPMVASAAGLFGPIFLATAVSYRFDLYNANDVLIYSQDDISTTTASNVDFSGTAGEALAAGKIVYQSDGSGSKTVGRWYVADPSQTYSSTLPLLGMVQSAIGLGNTGTIRSAGIITGLTSLTSGTPYYLTTAGALTATPPSTNARLVGIATSTTSLYVQTTLYGSVIEFAGGIRIDGVTDLAGYKETDTAISIATNVLTVNLALGSYFHFTLNANINTTTISNIPASGKFASFILEMTANGSGFTWTFLTSTVKWPGGVAPTMTTTNNKIDRYLFFSRDGGSTWAGAILGQNYAG